MQKCSDPACKAKGTVAMSRDGKVLWFCGSCAAAWLDLRLQAKERVQRIVRILNR